MLFWCHSLLLHLLQIALQLLRGFFYLLLDHLCRFILQLLLLTIVVPQKCSLLLLLPSFVLEKGVQGVKLDTSESFFFMFKLQVQPLQKLFACLSRGSRLDIRIKHVSKTTNNVLPELLVYFIRKLISLDLESIGLTLINQIHGLESFLVLLFDFRELFVA